MEVKLENVSYLDERNELIKNISNDIKSSSIRQNKELLLQDINLKLEPGSVTVFVGNSIGQRRLLECIALRPMDGYMAGNIQYDSALRKGGAFKDIAFVTSDIGYVNHFDSLSVFDYLYYCARLRVSHGNIECRERARSAIRLVGLDGSTKIYHLTKGEMRLLNIASELVGHPTLICLMEPLLGLDASSALDIMRILFRIAKRTSMPTTVIYTVDGLDEDMMRYTDTVALFHNSHLLIATPFSEFSNYKNDVMKLLTRASILIKQHEISSTSSAISVFLSSLPFSPYTNVKSSNAETLEKCLRLIVTEIIDLTRSSNDYSNPIATIPQISRNDSLDFSPLRNNSNYGYMNRNHSEAGWLSIEDKLYRGSNSLSTVTTSEFLSSNRRLGDLGVPHRQHKTLLKEVIILCSRGLQYHLKNRLAFNFSFFRFVIAGFVIGVLAFAQGKNLETSQLIDSNGLVDPAAYNISSALFILVAMSVVGVSFAVPYMYASAKILKNEINLELHSTLSTWLCLLLTDMPMFLLGSIAVSTIVFFMLHLQCKAQTFFGSILIVTLAGYSLASACAIWSRSTSMATFVFAFYGACSLVFSGYLEPIILLPGMWPWASNTAFTRWGFESLMLTVFGNENGDAFLVRYGFFGGSTTFTLGWMAIWLTGLQVIVLLGLLPSKFFTRSRKTDVTKIGELDMPPAIENSNKDNIDNTSNIGDNVINIDTTKFTINRCRSDRQTVFTFHRIKYIPNDDFHDSVDPMIQGISGRVDPGGSLCIIDGNDYGAGRVLLQVLAGRNRTMGKTSGIITANGVRRTGDSTYLNAAYVPCGDVFSTLSVKQTLIYAGYLRQHDRTDTCCGLCECNCLTTADDYKELEAAEGYGSYNDLDDKISEVLEMMALSTLANIEVYRPDGTCNLTPSELRCLTIACELIHRPGLIFMDDPIGGLSWYDAEIVAKAIETLSVGGRTIISVLNKPCKRVVDHFSDLLLIGSGKMIYFGPTAKATNHFNNIGFQMKSGQNSFEYLLDIAADKGVMAATNGKRGITLSPEDLADLCRSLANINIGTSSKADNSTISPSNNDSSPLIKLSPFSNRKSTNTSLAIGKEVAPPLLSTVKVLASRGFMSILSDKKALLYFLLRYLIAGFIVGSVWWNMEENNYGQRVSLLATTYFCMSVSIVDFFEGIHQRKDTFLRESSSNASSYMSYWLADSGPLQILNVIASFIFCIPVYRMSGLRPDVKNFFYFYLLVLGCIYSNLGLAYFLSTMTKSYQSSMRIFNGILMPIQLCTSGYLFLIPNMVVWYKWIIYINPMYYFLTGAFDNEFKSNANALGTNSFDSVASYYGFTLNRVDAALVLFGYGFVYRLLWLLLLRTHEVVKNREIMERVGAAKKRARNIISASLRWSNKYKTTTMSIEEEALAELEIASTLHNTRLFAKTELWGKKKEEERIQVDV